MGTVSKVGSKVSKFKPGQRVWSISLGVDGRQGSFAEYAAIDEDLAFAAPENVEDKQIVAVIQAAMTAYQGLLNFALINNHHSIFVNGGSGNVGSAIIQIAKAVGAKVFTASSGSEKMAWCKSIRSRARTRLSQG